MLQRIQTLYLLISLGLMGWFFALPIVEFAGVDGAVYEMNFKGLQKMVSGGAEMIYPGWPATILLGVICLMHVVIIFSYKKRIRQIRMIVFSILLMAGFLGLTYYLSNNYADLVDASYSYNIIAIFPAIAIVLDYLAIRAIGKDEALIRSIDRIR